MKSARFRQFLILIPLAIMLTNISTVQADSEMGDLVDIDSSKMVSEGGLIAFKAKAKEDVNVNVTLPGDWTLENGQLNFSLKKNETEQLTLRAPIIEERNVYKVRYTIQVISTNMSGSNSSSDVDLDTYDVTIINLDANSLARLESFLTENPVYTALLGLAVTTLLGIALLGFPVILLTIRKIPTRRKK